jgi:hypothetical protein
MELKVPNFFKTTQMNSVRPMKWLAFLLRGKAARLLPTEPFNVGDPTQSPHRRHFTLDYLEQRKSGTMRPGFGVLGLAPC